VRSFRLFKYRDASYNISLHPESASLESVYKKITGDIVLIRESLEEYIKKNPVFLSSLKPVSLLPGAPPAAVMMAEAAELTGTGPMAAVAGAIAQLAAEMSRQTAVEMGVDEIIIENGGDIFICPTESSSGRAHARAPEREPVTAGIFSGTHSRFSDLALKIPSGEVPVSVCSSSGKMGHSLSLGDCDLSTVFSVNAALADAAATLGGNMVRREEDLGPAAEKIASIPGIDGVLLIKNSRISMAGRLPELVRKSGPARLVNNTETVIIG
jgi:ApbE superfamily uncharacterized protein (UPF0280 family)